MPKVRLTTLWVCSLAAVLGARPARAQPTRAEPAPAEVEPALVGAKPPPSAVEPATAAASSEEPSAAASSEEPSAAAATAPDPSDPTAGTTEPAPPLRPAEETPGGEGAAEPPPPWLSLESRGEIGFEGRAFWPDDTALTRDANGTMAGRLHVDAAAWRLTGKARVFSRFDPGDRARSVLIAEELWIELKLPHARLRAGYQMINWTATEAFHPADVINSRYLDSAIENPEKLGEPMASLRIEIPRGNVDAMLMPVFVEPIFPTARSRQRFFPPGLALGDPIALGRDGEIVGERSAFPAYRFVPQGALRVSQTWGSADLSLHGLAHVDRSYPAIAVDPASGRVHPLFLPVIQAGGTYQQALGAWLLKLEAAYRWYRRPPGALDPFGGPIPERDHFVGAAGLEYGLPHANGSESTLLFEGQLFVPRDPDIPDYAKPLFQHDALVGVRHAFNDEASRAVTLVGIVDLLRPQEFFVNAGYAQRLGETWSLQAGLRFVRVPPRDPANPQVFEWLNNSHQAYANLFRHF